MASKAVVSFNLCTFACCCFLFSLFLGINLTDVCGLRHVSFFLGVLLFGDFSLCRCLAQFQHRLLHRVQFSVVIAVGWRRREHARLRRTVRCSCCVLRHTRLQTFALDHQVFAIC